MNSGTVITILGSAGGVARAVLALLNKAAQDPTDPIHPFVRQCRLHLVDRRQKGARYYRRLLPDLQGQFTLHRFGLSRLDRLRQHLRQTATDIVLDVSWGDTLDMLRCCDESGIRYVNTALENARIDRQYRRYHGIALAERVRLFEQQKGNFRNTTAIVCSGMNPGVVQWMALELLKQTPGERPLGCFVVEHDTSFFANPALADPQTIYVTWAPECFLDEAIHCYPMFVSGQTPVFLREPVYATEFRVTLGAKRFHGCLMPHEEAFTLSRALGVESGFLYRVSEHTTGLIRAHLAHADDLWDFNMAVLDPTRAPLTGEDLVGVLLVYKDRERYMYNVLSNTAVFAEYGVSATYFQVACGVYGALATLLLDPIPAGVHYVDELIMRTGSRYGEYLSHRMTEFVVGENPRSDGLLLQRLRRADG